MAVLVVLAVVVLVAVVLLLPYWLVLRCHTSPHNPPPPSLT